MGPRSGLAKFWLGKFPYGNEVENQNRDPNPPYGPAELAWSVGSHANSRVLKYCRTRGSKVIVPITESLRLLLSRFLADGRLTTYLAGRA